MLSDSVGKPAWSYAIGRDVMDLDFMDVTDHDMSFARDTGIAGFGDGDRLRTRGGMSLSHWHDVKPVMQSWGQGTWRYVCDVADQFDEPGRFVTLKGYERGQGRIQPDGTQPGHRNVYYRQDGPFLSSQDDAYGTPEKLWAHLVPGQAMTIPHSPAYTLTATGIDWRHYDERFDRAVEVFSSHGCSEFYGNPVPLKENQTDADSGYMRKALALGYHLGMVASTDGHAGIYAWTDPGRTLRKGAMVAVWATELTREAVFDAIGHRRCYGVEGGARIILRFTANGHATGSEIEASGEVHIWVQVLAEDTIKKSLSFATAKRSCTGALRPPTSSWSRLTANG